MGEVRKMGMNRIAESKATRHILALSGGKDSSALPFTYSKKYRIWSMYSATQRRNWMKHTIT